MAPRRAQYFSYGDDNRCKETQDYITEAGILLEIRDLDKNPLSFDELSKLFGYLSMDHFLNKMSKSYEKNGLDKKLPEREELFKMIADDNTLLMRPIIKTARLLTVGCDKKKISEMLMIAPNGKSHVEEQPRTKPSQNRSNNRTARPRKKEEVASSGK